MLQRSLSSKALLALLLLTAPALADPELKRTVRQVEQLQKKVRSAGTVASDCAPVDVDAKSAVPRFCTDPVAAVCSGDSARSARAERIARLKAAATADDLGSSSALGQAIDRMRRDLAGGVGRVLGEDVPGPEVSALVSKAVVLTSPGSWPDALFANEKITNELLNAYENRCGADSLADSAFSYYTRTTGRKKRRTNYVIICPGWVMASADDSDNLLQVAAHEIGHHIEATQPGLHAKYLDCLKTSYPKDFVPTGTKELASDYWAVQATAERLASTTTASYAARLKILREAWGGICGTAAADYPPGAYRIGVVLRTDPRINKLMGCEDAGKSSSYLSGCSLEGAVELRR